MRKREWQRQGQLPEVARSGSTWRASSGDEGSEGCPEQGELLPVGRGERKTTGFSDTCTKLIMVHVQLTGSRERETAAQRQNIG